MVRVREHLPFTVGLPSGRKQLETAAGLGRAAEYQRQRLRDGADCLAAALDYLARGWPVLCLCPPDHVGVGKGHRCDSPGKRPLHDWREFQRDRLPTAAEVRGWWRRWPTANVGVALGRLVRLDLEGPEAEGRLWELSGGELPETLEFSSGRADGTGRGLLYAVPEGVEVRTAVEGLALGELRLQALGAQTALPPSRHASGRRYSWRAGHAPVDREPAPAPAWLLDALRPKSKFRDRAEGGTYRDPGEPVTEGGRHKYLTRVAGMLRGRAGVSVDAIRARLLTENEVGCDPPLPAEEVERIALDSGGWEQGPRTQEGAPDPRRAASIIADYWKERYDIPHHREGVLFSQSLARPVKAGELLGAPTSDLIGQLAAAVEAPRDQAGKVDSRRLPALFRTWAPVALGDLLASLPEEANSLDAVKTAAEEFRRQLSAALLTLHTLGKDKRDAKGTVVATETERRTVIEWAARFAKSTRWADVRSLCVWSCLGMEGEVRVAIRAELFSQIHAPELARITPRRLAELASLYQLGSACKVEGGDKRAVELDPEFVKELLGRGCPDPDNRDDGRTDDRRTDEETGARTRGMCVRPSVMRVF